MLPPAIYFRSISNGVRTDKATQIDPAAWDKLHAVRGYVCTLEIGRVILVQY